MEGQQLNLPTMGRLRSAVLDQTEVWVDASGVEHRLDEMPEDYLANLIPFLARHGETLRAAWCFRHSFSAAQYDDTWAAATAGLDEAMEQPFAEWLEERDLVRRIRKLLPAKYARRPWRAA